MTQENVIDDITIKELDSVCEKACEIKREIQKLEEAVSERREELKLYENRLSAYLEHIGRDGWKFANGDIEVRKRTSVKIPRDESSKRALFEWLSGRGIFYEVVSVNSQTLNALYRSEMESCQQEGKTCVIPGISDPTEYSQIIIKTKKG